MSERPFHERIVAGVELESYTISTCDFSIRRELAFPKKGVGEAGERFARDASIGTEYNSAPFSTIREGLFLLKAGLRKYNPRYYRRSAGPAKGHQLLLVGGWRDRFAGSHLHLSVADTILTQKVAADLAYHLHDHLPLVLAVAANSPVWADEITDLSSNRVHRASKKYFRPIRRKELRRRLLDEMTFNRGRVKKPPTVEVRVMDSNIPEFVMAGVCIMKAVSLAWLAGKRASNLLPHAVYLQARANAAVRGMRARLCWNGEWVTAPRYLDRFIWSHREELREMDIPEDLWETLRLLKRRVSGSSILSDAARRAHQEHPQTWQRRFAKRYTKALEGLLSGNPVSGFARELGVRLPDTERVWLGRRNLKL